MAMARFLHLVDVLLDAGHRLLRNRVGLLYLLLADQTRDTRSGEQYDSDDEGRRPERQHQCEGSDSRGDEGCEPEDGQQSRHAKQTGTEARVLGRFSKLGLRQLHFISNQPRRLR